MTISGFATAEGTKRYQQRFASSAEDHFREEQALALSSIGIGTYLGNPDQQTDQNYTETVVEAVKRGANVIELRPIIDFKEVSARSATLATANGS